MMDTTHERADRLAALMQALGFAIWQLQQLEGVVAAYLVVRVRARRGTGSVEGNRLTAQAEGQTFGSLLADLAKSGVIAQPLSVSLQDLLKERNWLVHRICRENHGVVNQPERLLRVLERLQAIARRSAELQKAVADEMESYVLSCGIDRATIDAEADRLARSWGFDE